MLPSINPIDRKNIPPILTGLPQWINWRAGPLKANGKLDKIPTDPVTGQNINHLDPRNWSSFAAAVHAYDNDVGHGVGFVLNSKQPIIHNGDDHYLVALDFDNVLKSNAELKELWDRLGKPYVEVSPSGKGLRMFALSKELLKGGNDGLGHEVYCGNHFVTVTGWEARGKIIDATAGLAKVDRLFFGPRSKPSKDDLGSNVPPASLRETDKNIEQVKDQLSRVSSETDHDTWRDIVWSVLSTGWTCAEAIAKAWSMEAPHRYEEAAFDILVHSFDPYRGITLGTLHHHATQNGWKPAPPAGDTARLLSAAEVKAMPNQPYRVRGLLPAQGVAAIYGEAGSGKSFLAMDLGFSIAAGHADWFDMAVKPAPVAYVVLEGRGGVSKRIKAWEKHNQQSVAGAVRFLLSDFSLLDPKGIEKLGAEIIASLSPSAVVIVDTLNQSAPGADENASKDMGLILGNAKQLAERVQGLVILVHHAGKDPTRGMRGHSSLFAAMDAVMEVTKSHAERSWNLAKGRDDDGGKSSGFELVSYVVDVDADGLDVISCAVRQTINLPVVTAKTLSGVRQVAAMAKLRALFAANPNGISRKGAIAGVASVLKCPPGRQATVAKETIERLVANGHLLVDDDEGVRLR
jgi:hypothetical protein